MLHSAFEQALEIKHIMSVGDGMFCELMVIRLLNCLRVAPFRWSVRHNRKVMTRVAVHDVLDVVTGSGNVVCISALRLLVWSSGLYNWSSK